MRRVEVRERQRGEHRVPIIDDEHTKTTNCLYSGRAWHAHSYEFKSIAPNDSGRTIASGGLVAKTQRPLGLPRESDWPIEDSITASSHF